MADDAPEGVAGGADGFGIGLANVRDRLAARFGAEAQLTTGPNQDGGWRTVLRMPLERHAG